MPFTVANANAASTGSGTSQSVNLTISAGQTAVLAVIAGPSGTGFSNAGSVADNNAVAYTAVANVLFNGSFGHNINLLAAFYSIGAAAATSLTYTMPTGTGNSGLIIVGAWALTPTAGTVTNSGSAYDFSNTFGTGTNACTSGACAITSTDAIVLGFGFDNDNNDLSIGTGFSSDATNYNAIAEHLAVSSGSATAATFSTSSGTDAIGIMGVSFSIGTAALPFLPLMGQQWT